MTGDGPAAAGSRVEGRWAVGVRRLRLDPGASGEAAFTVAGRRLTGPQQGFGRLWHRVYGTTIPASCAPVDAVAHWKEHFAELWPRTSTFLGGDEVRAGVVAPISVRTGPGMHLSTGVLVLYSDAESFTFMTPEGHMFAGWITFSAEAVTAGTRLQIDILIRPNDPLYELLWPLMKRGEDLHWRAVLGNLAEQLCGRQVEVDERSELLDRRPVWRNWPNVRYNAAVRTTAWMVSVPWRAARARRRPRP